MNITKEERERSDRFITAFNAIHDFMQKEFNANNEHFGILLAQMLDKKLIRQRDHEFLDECRDLRNYIVHNKKLYIAIPSIHVVERAERLLNRLNHAPTVFSEFATKVQIVDANDTMYRVMKIVEETGFTQFPVYENGKFANLLTENVLTRWLAKHVVFIQEMAFADLRDTAGDALQLHNDDQHWEFIPRHMTIATATAMFAERPVLEALIITERGHADETPIGIVTRSDALDMLDGKRDTHPHVKV